MSFLSFKGILVNNVEDCDISYTDLTSEQVMSSEYCSYIERN